jgi:hypothetical protein
MEEAELCNKGTTSVVPPDPHSMSIWAFTGCGKTENEQGL